MNWVSTSRSGAPCSKWSGWNAPLNRAGGRRQRSCSCVGESLSYTLEQCHLEINDNCLFQLAAGLSTPGHVDVPLDQLVEQLLNSFQSISTAGKCQRSQQRARRSSDDLFRTQKKGRDNFVSVFFLCPRHHPTRRQDHALHHIPLGCPFAGSLSHTVGSLHCLSSNPREVGS